MRLERNTFNPAFKCFPTRVFMTASRSSGNSMGKDLSSSVILGADKLVLLPLALKNKQTNKPTAQTPKQEESIQIVRTHGTSSVLPPQCQVRALARAQATPQPLIPVCSGEARTGGTPRCMRNPGGIQTPVGTVTAKLRAHSPLSHGRQRQPPSGAAPHRGPMLAPPAPAAPSAPPSPLAQFETAW